MIYINPGSRQQMKSDLVRFYQSAGAR